MKVFVIRRLIFHDEIDTEAPIEWVIAEDPRSALSDWRAMHEWITTLAEVVGGSDWLIANWAGPHAHGSVSAQRNLTGQP